LTHAQLYFDSHNGDETELDGTASVDTNENGSILKSADVTVVTQPGSDISHCRSTNARRPTSTTRTYKYVRLQQAMAAANLLLTNNDRVQFETEYFESVSKKTFEQFLDKYWHRIRQHEENLKKERASKKERAFTFVDLEENFLALDPTRNVKIIFVDEMPATTYVLMNNGNG
jgi:hypothetical protein